MPTPTPDPYVDLRQWVAGFSPGQPRGGNVAQAKLLLIAHDELARSRANLLRQQVALQRQVRLLEEERDRLAAVVAKHDLCHDLHGKVGAPEFAAGCAAEQRKQYGRAPDADEVARLTAELALWRPLTPAEAERALDEARAAPFPEEQIREILARAVDPAERLDNSEQAQLAAAVRRLTEELAAVLAALATAPAPAVSRFADYEQKIDNGTSPDEAEYPEVMDDVFDLARAGLAALRARTPARDHVETNLRPDPATPAGPEEGP